MNLERSDQRTWNELRKVAMERNYTIYAEGSVLISCGNTRVICTASVEDKVPSFLKGTGQGWITAEYSMLPRSTGVRTPRSTSRGTINGRSSEIQRLIGRSLRASTDLSALGERTIWLDCDVIQADGGTRTASITGAFVALADALRTLWKNGDIRDIPLKTFVAAVSAGKVDGELLLDLCYEEDSRAEVDLNVIMTGTGDFIEIQGTGEGSTFSRNELTDMLDLAGSGIMELISRQKKVLDLSSEEEENIERFQDSFCKPEQA